MIIIIAIFGAVAVKLTNMGICLQTCGKLLKLSVLVLEVVILDTIKWFSFVTDNVYYVFERSFHICGDATSTDSGYRGLIGLRPYIPIM